MCFTEKLVLIAVLGLLGIISYISTTYNQPEPTNTIIILKN